MDLVPYIYCEKQEPGSMLCAQHALNNLMQSAIWSPEDLAEIARTLDSIEHSHLQGDSNSHDTQQGGSRLEKNSNCDDSGFFSVQVIDHALHRLGLRIISWRSEEMRPMHDYPENQEAFILNHDLHWFTLRRFGQSADRWYNLNSMTEDSPKWIGPTFLSMAIAQAEAEGYSIFVVTPVPASSDSSAPQPGRLLSCQADEHAHLLGHMSYTSGDGSSSGSTSALRRPREEVGEDASRTRMKMNSDQGVGMDELPYDEQIQLAIQASLSQSSSADQPGHTTKGGTSAPTIPQTDRSETSPTINHSPPSLPPETNIQSAADSELLDQLRNIEDDELAAAISESLAHHHQSEPNPSELPMNNNPVPPDSDDLIDEPTPEELRQRRLARFSQN
ncbi:hypothetical protein PCANC_03005 [Puccinia coronata f. sp. avenae]|uniref:Ataxin-3 homolog n=1 Tax=Puccinia coronata f. sp. avenae TaxID=200324 RepID=A0A2N5RVW6_9BASI|nr:hypothetical protein PCANC_27653 [Puccinia coronata f. sp. avenae]PLW42479.1 hypothetical protein PCASD_04653 [Puccinia coronata f. sp. avenae]PLW55974.1 hypothetical protein PCANC_03005 [Puccinia coronata f. sp. avenae]